MIFFRSEHAQSNTLKHLVFIFIFIFNLFKLAAETRKTIYESANDKKKRKKEKKKLIEKETSASEETNSSISYRKQVSRRRRVAYPYKITQLNKRQPN